MRSGQGWPRAWGWPSAGAGQAGMRRPGRPQLLPQVLAPLAAGKGELISELHPKQRRLLAPAGGSSASWGPVLALLLACSTTWDKLFGPRSLDRALPRWVGVGGCPQLAGLHQTAGWSLLTLPLPGELALTLCFVLFSRPPGLDLGLLSEGAPVIFFLPLSPFLSFCLNNNPQPVPHRSRASSSTLREPRLESRLSTYHHH